MKFKIQFFFPKINAPTQKSVRLSSFFSSPNTPEKTRSCFFFSYLSCFPIIFFFALPSAVNFLMFFFSGFLMIQLHVTSFVQYYMRDSETTMLETAIKLKSFLVFFLNAHKFI